MRTLWHSEGDFGMVDAAIRETALDVMITGVPVEYWIELRKPVRKVVERFLDNAHLPYEEVRIHFYPKSAPQLIVSFDCSRRLRTRRLTITALIDKLVRDHARKYKWVCGPVTLFPPV